MKRDPKSLCPACNQPGNHYERKTLGGTTWTRWTCSSRDPMFEEQVSIQSLTLIEPPEKDDDDE